MAVYITEWVNGPTPSGRVVLYDRSGPTSMITHRGIEGAGMVWDSTGLFFVDQSHDFQVTDSTVERRQRSRSAVTVAAMRGDGNGGRVVLFNDGLAGGHTHTGVGVYTGVRERSQHDLVGSTAAAIGSCADGFYLAGTTDEIGDQTSELVRLDPPGGAPPRRVASPTAGVFQDDAMGSPCRDGQVIGLVNKSYNGPVTAVPLEVWRWSTRDGGVKRTPMVTGRVRFSIDPDALAPTVARWLTDEELMWVDAFGVGWRTNMQTGLTTKVRDNMIAYFGPINVWALDGDHLIGFEYSADKSVGRLQVYSAKDMSLIETRELPQLKDVTPDGQMVLAFAVRPGYQPSNQR